MRTKIAFIGTHGVGKTVLTFSVASQLRKMGIDSDVAYENSRKSPFPINEATTFEGQLWILTTQIKTELECSLRCDFVVCDRSVLDNYAYMVNSCNYQHHLHPLIENWLQTYNVLFHIPIIENVIKQDKKRSLSIPFQLKIDILIRKLIDEFKVSDKLVILPEERGAHISTVMKELAKRSILPTDAFQESLLVGDLTFL